MEMETKSLRLQLSKGKVEQEYNLELDLPDKDEIIQILELPPHYILSKDEITFSNGLLGQMPHAIKLLISRDYQDLYMGLFIKIGEKSGQQVQISEVTGTFQSQDLKVGLQQSTFSVETATVGGGNNGVEEDGGEDDADDGNNDPDANANVNNVVQNMWNYQPVIVGGAGVVHQYPLRVHQIGHSSWHNHAPNFGPIGNNVYHPLYNTPRHVRMTRDRKKKGMLFSFQKQSPEMRLEDLKQFQHYRSYSHTWPVKKSRVKLTIKVVGIKFSSIVDDEDMSLADLKMGSCLFNAESFFMSEYCSDIKLKVGSRVIPGHKIVLSAKSDFFNRMFSNPMREVAEGIVELEDDESHLIEVLRFIYLGRIDDIDNHAGELLVLADKYQIEDLGIYCEKYLLSKLCVENAIEMFDLSHSVGKKGILAKRSKELIMWNKEKFAPDLETFKEFFNKYPELIFEILKL